MSHVAAAEQVELGAAFLSATKLGYLLAISTATVHDLAARGDLPRPFLVGSRRRWRREEIDAWLETRREDGE